MNDVKSFEPTVQHAKVPPIYLRFHNKMWSYFCDILNYVLCEPSHAWDLVQFFTLALYLN